MENISRQTMSYGLLSNQCETQNNQNEMEKIDMPNKIQTIKKQQRDCFATNSIITKIWFQFYIR